MTTPNLPQDLSARRIWWCRFLACLLIMVSAGLRIGYMASAECTLDLSQDEAHYWDWSRQLDWSYYCKPPLVAYLIRGSRELTEPLSLEWTGQAMLAVRLPAIVCGSLLLLSLYVLTVQVFRREGLALGVVAAALTMPLITAGSSLITIDAPYICCWGWALVFSYEAIFRQRNWAWFLAGLMVALGLLAKQTMILYVPCVGLFLLITPSLRRLLLQPGFWAMALVGALGSVPILYWNYQHDWVTLRHIQGHAGLQSQPTRIFWFGPLHYIGTQFAVLLGYWFLVWCGAMWMYRPGRGNNSESAYLWWMSFPVFIFFLAFSLKNGGGEPNWPMTAYLAGLVLGAGWLAQQLQAPRAWYRHCAQGWLILFCGVGLGLAILVHNSHLAYPFLQRLSGPSTAQNPFPIRRLDPTCRLQGWHVLGKALDRIREELQEQGVVPILAADSWTLPGEISFYCQGQPVTYCLGPAVGERHSQYDIWRPNPIIDPQAFAGRTFILIGDPSRLKQAFDHVETPRKINFMVGDLLVNQWFVTVARGFHGFPNSPSTKRGY